MGKSEASVEELIGKIERGELRLPEMQRRYVWRATRVRDLFDSLYRGYPSGAILLWESSEPVPLQVMAVTQAVSAFKNTQLLLDGQQRLTSLLAVIRDKPVSVRGRVRPIELLFNLEHPEKLDFTGEFDEAGSDAEAAVPEDENDATEDELLRRFNQKTFVVSTRKLAQLPQWVKVSEVFKTDSDAAFLKRAGMTGFEDANYERYSQRLARLRAIRKYMYRMDVLERELDYKEVTEIFVRVNSLGAKLRSSDLALAQITAKWPNSLALFEAFQQACLKDGFDLDLGLLLKNMMAFATGQSRFLSVGNLSREVLQTGWDQGQQGLQFALNFLKNNAGIDSITLLASPFIVVTVAYFGYKRDYSLSPVEEQQLRKWVLIANAKGRYSRGSSETLLDQDLATLRDGEGVPALVERLRQQVGRLDIEPDELEGRNQRSAMFKTMFLAFRAANAKDWRSQVGIALDHAGTQHKLQFHHIFPKAVLRGHYTRRQADDICNLCFISGRTNRQISDRLPAAYFQELQGNVGFEPFVAQCIPTASELLSVTQYRQFLLQRRELVAARLNEFLTA